MGLEKAYNRINGITLLNDIKNIFIDSLAYLRTNKLRLSFKIGFWYKTRMFHVPLTFQYIQVWDNEKSANGIMG